MMIDSADAHGGGRNEIPAGNIVALYFRDPDGNPVEIAIYADRGSDNQ